MLSLVPFVVFALFTSRASAAGPSLNLPIVNGNVSPDGFTRPAVLAGGTFPGTLITGNKGDNFRINVQDQLTDNSMLKSTSIHWHGFFQAGTNWADGPAFVTQCPISPGHSFLYDFKSQKQAGTFWYHSHLSAQYCDGLRGPMVVYDSNDPHRSLYDVDNANTVITLADWYHAKAKDALLISPFPTADSTLINGLGRYAGGPASRLAVIRVIKGLRYRFRLVSLSCDPNFTFSIDGHDLTVIEVDGVNHKPYTVNQIQIFAGQRYSFVLKANQAIKNYWIRANPNLGTTGFAGGINSAILRYILAGGGEPTTTPQTSVVPLVEANLVPLESPGAPGAANVNGADVSHNLALTFDFPTFKLLINGEAWESPTVPVLLQIMSGASSAASLLPSGSVYTLPPNKVVQISLPAGVAGGPHPFHLHGHAFDVIRSAGQSTYNYVNPPRRDVVSIGGAGDNVTIRFRTDNPGPWFLHCHIDWHLEAGFAIAFAEDVGATASANPVPVAWSELCPTYNALAPTDH